MALSEEDCSVDSGSRADSLQQLFSLFRACPRPAAGDIRRRYLCGLARWPVDYARGLHYSSEVGHRLDEALRLCRLLAAPSSHRWREAEADIYRALPAVYQGEQAPAPSAPYPRLSSLVNELQTHRQPDRCVLGIARWAFFSCDMTSIDEGWCDLLHSLSDQNWRLVSTLRATPEPQSEASPLAGHHGTVVGLCHHTGRVWRQAVMPRLRRLCSTSQRLDVLEGIVGLSWQEAQEALEVCTGGGRLGGAPTERLRAWLSLSGDHREWASRQRQPVAELSAPLLSCLNRTAGWPSVARRRLHAGLTELGEQGHLGGLTGRHYDTLAYWYRWQEGSLSREGLAVLTGLDAAAVAEYASYAGRVPLDIVPLVRRCRQAEGETEDGDRCPSIDHEPAALMRACCDAYLMGARREDTPAGGANQSSHSPS